MDREGEDESEGEEKRERYWIERQGEKEGEGKKKEKGTG